MFKNVFISYAKEDIEVANQLYDFLHERRFNPWLDEKKLRPGSNWEYEIKQALRSSDFVILLLSSTSVIKRGYVQREFKLALDYAQSKLEDDIYIIPVLIDKCNVPLSLQRFQWITINQANFKEYILESINFQRQKYISTLSDNEIEINEYGSQSIDLNVNYDFAIDYECDLPLFFKNKHFDASFINTYIQQKAFAIISEYRNWLSDQSDLNNENPIYIDIHYNISYLTKDFISMTIINDSYLGGAHPNTIIHSLNFKLNPERTLSLSDIVKYKDLNSFLEYCLKNYGDEDQNESLGHHFQFIDEANIEFVFNESTLVLIFTNFTPRVIMSLSFLEIPITKLELTKEFTSFFMKS